MGMGGAQSTGNVAIDRRRFGDAKIPEQAKTTLEQQTEQNTDDIDDNILSQSDPL